MKHVCRKALSVILVIAVLFLQRLHIKSVFDFAHGIHCKCISQCYPPRGGLNLRETFLLHRAATLTRKN